MRVNSISKVVVILSVLWFGRVNTADAQTFKIADRGGVSVVTDGSGDLKTAHSRFESLFFSTIPSGVALVDFYANGRIVNEIGVPMSAPLTTARFYAEITDHALTAVAIANASDQAANVRTHFTDLNGVDFGESSTYLGPKQQVAMNLFSFNSPTGYFEGTYTLNSDVPVGVTAIRTYPNEHSPTRFSNTTLPVTDLSASATGLVTVPHFADGLGWTTQIILVNPTDSTITGTIQFFSGDTGAAVNLSANGRMASAFPYSIPRQSSFRLMTDGNLPETAGTPLTGLVHVIPSTGAAPSVSAIFSFKSGGTTVSESGADGVQGSAFRMYVEETTETNAVHSAVAIANLDVTPTTVNVELTNLDGSPIGQVTTLLVPGNGEVSKLIRELFPNISVPFKGILRISGGGVEGLSVLGLRIRFNDLGDILTASTPASNEATLATSSDRLFPYLLNGLGWTTQFVLFNGSAGQTSSGELEFFNQDGTPLNLTLK